MQYLTKKSIKLPKRNPKSHKGQNGRVMIIGGSLDYTGTLALAGIAALRSGADIVTVFAPSKVSWALNCLSADLVTRKLKGDYLNKRHIDGIIGFDNAGQELQAALRDGRITYQAVGFTNRIKFGVVGVLSRIAGWFS